MVIPLLTASNFASLQILESTLTLLVLILATFSLQFNAFVVFKFL